MASSGKIREIGAYSFQHLCDSCWLRLYTSFTYLRSVVDSASSMGDNDS